MRIALLFFVFLFFASTVSSANQQGRHWVSILTPTKEVRTEVSNLGVPIINIVDDHSYAIVSDSTLDKLKKSKFKILSHLPMSAFSSLDYPARDSAYHNYDELRTELERLANEHSDLVTLETIGISVLGRDILAMRINPDVNSVAEQSGKPGIIFMGGHHAREHLSVEIPLLFLKYFLENYDSDPALQRLAETRDIFVVPLVNPDGAEFDIETGSYKTWRKNRSRADARCAGTDLNRNYSFMWGTGGSSNNECSDTYMGPQPFSEPETRAIKNFVEYHPNLKILLSFHTFSELILYPWGHKYDPIEDERDRQIHETLARTMAGWNGYTPQQSSDLYIASGDTTDWSYGALGLVSFTFELSPSRWGGGGFYPGPDVIQPTFRANLRPMLYLIDLADDPYRGVTNPETTLFFGW